MNDTPEPTDLTLGEVTNLHGSMGSMTEHNTLVNALRRKSDLFKRPKGEGLPETFMLLNQAADTVEELAGSVDLEGRALTIAVRQLREARAERDALRAQLDGMTVEWATENRDSIHGPDRDVWESEDAARNIAKEYEETLAKRLVGPWVEVE